MATLNSESLLRRGKLTDHTMSWGKLQSRILGAWWMERRARMVAMVFVVADSELLEVVECPRVEPARQLDVGGEAEEAESAGGARVLGDDLGDGGGEDKAAAEGIVGGAGVDLEVQRRRTP
jgi:hypothetical protein